MTSRNQRPVDLALYIPSLGQGGIERVYLNLAEELVRQGVRVDLLVAQAWGARQSDVPSGARVVDLAAHRRGTLWLLPGFLRYLRRAQPQAVLACSGLNLPAIWAKLWFGSRSRVVIAVHSTLSLQFASLGRGHRMILPRLLATFYPKADAVVAVSGGVAEDLCRFLGLERARVEVLHNPVVTNHLLTRMEDPLGHRWFRESEPPVILGVGSLTPRKDFTTLLRAFALVRRQRRVRLVILGEGSERTRLDQLARELSLEDDVYLPGFVSNPYPYFRRARMFVLSSRWEGLPTNVIEALACACPVVATDCPGAREILENGSYGRLVPIGDVRSMAQAMLETLVEHGCRHRLTCRAMDFHIAAGAKKYREVCGV